MQTRDLTLVAQFLERHQIGVDDLFFLMHLGAKQIANDASIPAEKRAAWARIREECYTLWHNSHGSGEYLHQDAPQR